MDKGRGTPMEFEKIREAKKPKKKAFLCRLTPGILESVDGIAKELGISRAKFIDATLAEAVRHFRPVKEKK